MSKQSHLRHRFAPCNEEVIPQRQEVQHASAIFTAHIPSHPPLHEAHTVRVVRICLHKPNPTSGQLLQTCRKTLRAAAGFLEEVVEFPQNTLPRQDTL